MIKWEKALIDADFSFKLGKLEHEDALIKYVGALVDKIYIHRYIYDTEILTPKRVRAQIDQLITQDRAEIVDLSSLPSALEKALYQEVVKLLKQADTKTREMGKNWGETVSLAYAKASSIPYFLSDEKDLQQLADDFLNNENAQDIQVIRVRDFILALKEAGFRRKECQMLWLVANFDPERKEESREWAKEVFNQELWFLEK